MRRGVRGMTIGAIGVVVSMTFLIVLVCIVAAMSIYKVAQKV